VLKNKGVEVEIVEYLKDVPSHQELKDLLMKLNMKPQEILRTGEKIFKEEYKGLEFTDEEWINVMHENPKLIERPIVVKGNKAVIGRPPENVNELF
tara:strand:+ start:345 stop:632 length:288 start_codon:yes stop_codon:yes gene_type:complete